MRTFLFAALTAFAVNASAGVAYEFVTNFESPRFKEKSTGRVWFEGSSYRAEVTRPDGKRMAVISRDADETARVIDLQKNEIADRTRVNGDIRSSALFLFPGSRVALKGKPQVKYRRVETPVMIAEQPATQHVIEGKFDAATKDGVRATYQFTARIWTSETLPPLPMKSALRTGYPAVDAKVDEAAKNVRGMVLRHELEVTRTIEGGEPQVERTSTVVTKLEQTTITDDVFSPSFR